MTEQEVIAEAERRYHFDAEFHARVHIAVGSAEVFHRQAGGALVNDLHRHIARMAAAVALLITEIPIEELIGA